MWCIPSWTVALIAPGSGGDPSDVIPLTLLHANTGEQTHGVMWDGVILHLVRVFCSSGRGICEILLLQEVSEDHT